MGIGELIQGVLGNNITATAIYGLVVLFFVDFLTGVTKAISRERFDFAYFDSWVRSKGVRLVNILLVLIAGAALPNLNILGFEVNPLTTLGMAWAATSAATVVASIYDNVNPDNRRAIPEEFVSPGPRVT